MAEEEKSQKIVETYKAVAAGIASVVAAVFTSKLGVAGTLIGTALTATIITLVAAVLKVQLMKASDTVSGIPSVVQGRLSTQQLRIPGKPNVEPNPELAAQLEAEGGGGKRSPGLLSRLRAVPGVFRELPSVQRRKMLLAGLLAGLVATVIGLSGVTGIELAGGNTLSCMVWSCPEDESDPEKSSGRSGLSIFGGRSVTGPGVSTQEKNAVPPGTPSSGDPSEQQPFAPESDRQIPQQRQPAGQPAQPGADDEEAPQQSDARPTVTEDPAQQPGDYNEPVPDEKDEAEPPPDDRQSSPQRGAVEDQQTGAKKEDRG